MKKLLSMAVVGFTARWLFDKAEGERRRSMVRDRLTGATRGLGIDAGGLRESAGGVRDAVAERGRDLAGDVRETVAERGRGLASSAGDVRDAVVERGRDLVPGGDDEGGDGAADADRPGGGDFLEDPATFAGNPDDARLTDKVETELFRPEGVPKGNINVNVEFGKVVLRGEVDSQELIDDLVRRAREIDGVTDVESLLHLPGEPAPMHE